MSEIPEKPVVMTQGNTLTGMEESRAESLLAAPAGYTAWRASAEKRLEKMQDESREHRRQLSRLDGEINDLLGVMGNGASGGTAWMRHNDQAHLQPGERAND